MSYTQSNYLPLTTAAGEPISVWTDKVISTSNQGTVVEAFHDRTQVDLVAKLSHTFPEHSSESNIAQEKMNMLRELHILPRLIGVAGVPQFVHAQRIPAGQGMEQFVLVMSKLPGQDLERRRKQQPQRRFTAPEALTMLRRIASILAAAHERSIIHRDLKLSNFMLTDNDEYSIVDWGTAQDLRHDPVDKAWSTPEKTVIGTVQFMSYEQITGKELDARTDVYSLGAVVALLRYGPQITQRYIINTDGKIVARHKDEIAKAVAKKESLKYEIMPQPDTADEELLQTVLRKMTQPERASRFSSMQEVLASL